MMELKCGTKIKWTDLNGLSKEGIIVKITRNYWTIDGAFYYYVIESDTGTRYGVKVKDIDFVNVDGEWISYRSSVRYSWDSNASDSNKNFIDNTVKDYIENDRKKRKSSNKKNWFEPKKVIFNGPATIVMWQDGTKTIVKRREGEPDDKEKAIMYCILKKLCGNKAAMDKYLKLFLKEKSNDEEKEES